MYGWSRACLLAGWHIHHQTTGMPEGDEEEELISGFCPSFFSQRLDCTARTAWSSGTGFYQYLGVATQRLSLPRTILTELLMVNFLKIKSSSIIIDKVRLKMAIKPSIINLYHFPFQLMQERNCCRKSLRGSGFKTSSCERLGFNSKRAISSQEVSTLPHHWLATRIPCKLTVQSWRKQGRA